MLDKLNKAIQDPGLAWAWACARMRPHRAAHRGTILARRAGMTAPLFILSFDCDTDADSAVAAELHERLRSGGLSPLYAVAGEVLEAGASAYRTIADEGGVFLNHGFRRHATLDEGTGAVTSNYFYGAVPTHEWQEDIRRGHKAVRDILGQTPEGFRTPHFASFEGPRDLAALWRFLTQLGYRYSSSTRPLFGLRFGPFFNRSGIVEFPVSGCLSEPGQILDSWGLVRTRGRLTDRLRDELGAYVALMRAGQPLLLNVYLDPADIADDDDIIELLNDFAPFSAPDFSAVLERAGHG